MLFTKEKLMSAHVANDSGFFLNKKFTDQMWNKYELNGPVCYLHFQKLWEHPILYMFLKLKTYINIIYIDIYIYLK